MIRGKWAIDKAGIPLGIVATVVAALGGALLFLRPQKAAVVDQDPEKRMFVEVKRVVSGQKIKLDNDHEEYLIYAGIRAPVGDEAMYDEATRRNAELVDKKKVRLRFDKDRRDGDGRLLAYVFVDDLFVNEALVREGLAFVRATPTANRFSERLLAAQAEARSARKGVWAKRMVGSATYIGDPKYGNYHKSECEEAGKIPKERKLIFKGDKPALDGGFAPCARCKP